MTDKKTGLSAHERRYIAVLATVVLIFLIIGIAMSLYQSTHEPAPVPVRVEDLMLADPQPDSTAIRRRQAYPRKTDGGTTKKKTSAKKRNKKTSGKQTAEQSTPSRGPVHNAPIPSE